MQANELHDATFGVGALPKGVVGQTLPGNSSSKFAPETWGDFPAMFGDEPNLGLHPGKLTWNLQITHLERNMIFQTFIFGFHVNLQGFYQQFVGCELAVPL